MIPAAAAPPERPDHLRVTALVAVFLGGAAGTALRWLVASALGPLTAAAWATWLVNLTGSLLIGWLTARLDRSAPTAGRRWWRLCLLPGLLGGYTTYSALALDAASLLAGGRSGLALAYGLSTVVLGTLAASVGLRLGRGTGAVGA